MNLKTRNGLPAFGNWPLHGIDKPVLNIFRMFGMMSGKRIAVKLTIMFYNAPNIIANGVRERNDINAIASKDQNSIYVMVWNYHDDDSVGKTSQIELAVNGIAGKKVISRHYRIDQHFSNSFEKWKAMGKTPKRNC